MKNISNKKEINYTKAHLAAFILDIFALGAYFGFEALGAIQTALIINKPEIIVDEGGFHTFMLLFPLALHLMGIIGMHTPISKSAYKQKFYNVYLILTVVIFFFSGYFVSYYVESKLKKAEYHFCENLSYEESYRSTHYVWRAKNKNCDTSIDTLETQ